MAAETLADLAGSGKLEGRRVRFACDDGEQYSSLPKRGTVGIVLDVRSSEAKATVHYVRPELHEGHPWREVTVESRFCFLELVEDH